MLFWQNCLPPPVSWRLEFSEAGWQGFCNVYIGLEKLLLAGHSETSGREQEFANLSKFFFTKSSGTSESKELQIC